VRGAAVDHRPNRDRRAAKSPSAVTEVICFNANIHLAISLKQTMLNFAAHRRPEHYGLIVARVGRR
jgi:N-carbamoyl-D-amino-acid hydrolase